MYILEKVLLYLAVLIPCMPKIEIAEGITMYMYEIVALVSFPLLFRYVKFEIQKTLMYLWIVVLISTILSCIFVFSSGGLMRCIKEIIYIPLMLLAFKNKSISLRGFVYVFMISFMANAFFLVSNGITSLELDIWNSDMLSSGFSNKIFSFSSLSVEVNHSTGGAHGIWMGYNALAVCVSYIAYKRKEISKILFIMSFLMGAFDALISVSREGLIYFICLFIGLSSDFMKIKGNKIKAAMIILFFLLVITYVVISYGENLAIVQKILYTQESIQSSGNESNITMRIGAWMIYFLSIIHNPLHFILGYGFNQDYYIYMNKAVISGYNGDFVTIPESFFIEFAMYGGVFALILGIIFWVKLFKFTRSLLSNYTSRVIKWLLFGLLIGNLLSGASIISDLLYSQLLIAYGIIYRYNINDNLCFRLESNGIGKNDKKVHSAFGSLYSDKG